VAAQLQVITGIATTLIALIAGLTLNIERLGRQLLAITRLTVTILGVTMLGIGLVAWGRCNSARNCKPTSGALRS
jgi:hypothetical protein